MAQPVVYVDAGATGANDGSSWTDAYADLQAALDAAEASGGAISEIWVADGTYKPSKRTDSDDPRSATFHLLDGVSFYGGFAGTETSIDQRDIEVNETILSGDFNGDDAPDFVNYDENAYHVVTAIDIENSIIFDGLTVTAGHAPDPGFLRSYGAGMHLVNAYPEIRNSTFTRNLAERPESNVAWSGGGGAALFLHDQNWDTEDPGPPLNVLRSRFTENRSDGDGAAVFIYGADATGKVVFSECTFERNVGLGAFSAFEGSAYTFRSCIFSDNSSNRWGSAIAAFYHGGDLSIELCRFERNTAQSFAAVNWNGGGRHVVTIRDSVFVGNDSAGALYVEDAETVSLIDSEFRGNLGDWVGGVSFVFGSSATVLRCQFVGNAANDGEGGGLYLYGWSSAQVNDSTFVNNRAISGGGLYVEGAVEATDCTFIDNRAAWFGGGLSVGYGVAELMRCRFALNSALEGGGVGIAWGSLTAVECAFDSNYAAAGGAVANNYEADILMNRCRLTKNSAQVGGGLSSTGASAGTTLFSSLFAENEATAYGGGIASGAGPLTVTNCSIVNNTAETLGAGMIVGRNATVTNSIVWGNVIDPDGGEWTDEIAQIEGIEFAEIGYSDVQGWSGAYGGDGNNGLDPLFVAPNDPDGQYGPEVPDFDLQPDSPCINAGLTKIIDWGPWYEPPPNLDLDGQPRVLCNLVDMGAYEFGLMGDVDCNQHVDLDDFSLWSECALGPGTPGLCPAFDSDGDGDIDLRDAAALFRAFSITVP